MLKVEEVASYPLKWVSIMSDLAILVASVKVRLQEISKQASALGDGLQNAAPGDRTGTPNNSVQYLFGIAESIATIVSECEKLLPHSSQDSSGT